MKLVWKILKSNISPWQLIGFALANLLGITILMTTLQFHHDVMPGLTGDNGLVEKDYLVVSKKANVIKSLMGDRGHFTDEDIRELKSDKRIQDVGEFKAANYDIYVRLDIGGGNVASSALFFESVPDRFVDSNDFEWKPASEETIIPIMIPKEYLDLYNFGFSASQGLPQLTEEVLKSLILDVDLRGDGKHYKMKGQIHGFSKYLNTVLVPESFMEWANENLAHEAGNKTGRVLLNVTNPTDMELIQEIEDKGYVIAQNKESYSKLTFFLNIVTGIILAVGLVISILSFFILTLSIWLLIEKNQAKINALELLGYSSTTIAVPYSILIAVIDLLTIGLSVGAVMGIRGWYSGILAQIIGLEGGAGYLMMNAGILFAVIVLLHIIVLEVTIRKVYRNR